MIGKGAQYLTAAGYGRYRITAASLGRDWIITWLRDATKQAIMAAFGADGTAVIRATNDYLNGIAAQGQAGCDKATALAGFINEDPMMVCSLGLEPQGVTMPVRNLYSDGTPGNIINTDIPLSEYAKITLDFQFLSPNAHQDQYLFRAWGGSVSNNSMSVNKFGNDFRFFYGPYTTSANNLTLSGNFNRHTIVMEKGYYTLDGSKNSRAWHLYDTSPACLQFFAVSATYGYCNAKIWAARVEENTYGNCNFIPCYHKVDGVTKVGVLNIEGATPKFYPAQGTIVIQQTP